MDIGVSNLSKYYAGKPALKGLALKLKHGEINCVTGASGCGKTTLLRLLAGLETPDEGDITGMEGRKLAFCFQEDRLIAHLSALENCQLALKGKRQAERAAQALNALNLGEALNKPPVRKFSGGMARRVALARAMLADADTVMLDEPFKGLDDENRARAREFVKSAGAGKTLIMVTHDAQDARALNANLLVLSAPN